MSNQPAPLKRKHISRDDLSAGLQALQNAQTNARDLDATLRDLFHIRRARWRNLTATLGEAADATCTAMTRFRTAYARKPMTSRPDGRLSA